VTSDEHPAHQNSIARMLLGSITLHFAVIMLYTITHASETNAHLIPDHLIRQGFMRSGFHKDSR
jgi:hypothetical protein